MASITEKLDINDESALNVLGHVINGMINDEDPDATPNIFVLMTVSPDGQIKYTGNLSKEHTRKLVTKVAIEWPE